MTPNRAAEYGGLIPGAWRRGVSGVRRRPMYKLVHNGLEGRLPAAIGRSAALDVYMTSA